MDANEGAGQDWIEHGTSGANDETDALISRLGVIEGQPLAERAAAFSQIYDSLQLILGGGGSDTPRR
jgi:hypothetical protein